MSVHEEFLALRSAMEKAVLGQGHVIDALLIALLTNGNVLLEGLPGTAKTRTIRTLANILDASLGRVQFTPDLLPSDVTGTEILSDVGGKMELTFQPGPIFNNLILADEINRAPAKVQSALLEAMEERQVTVAGHTHKLPELFMVLATQNPIEQEGTYPLPEAQMDRFLMKVKLDYPGEHHERDIIQLMRQEEKGQEDPGLRLDQGEVFKARAEIRNIHVSDAIDTYLVALIMGTREPERYGDSALKDWIQLGSSPRATIALDRAARAHAWLSGKDFVDPDDVRSVVKPVLRHRFVQSYDALAEGVDADEIIDELVQQVAVV